jgi:Co/Zn/Cd efflux system component
MHSDDPLAWTHAHSFEVGSPAAARSTRKVLWITACAMLVEIAAGVWFNSMALLAHG